MSDAPVESGDVLPAKPVVPPRDRPHPAQVACLIVGWAVIVFALHGMISEPASNPHDLFRLLIGLNVVNDTLVIPVVLAISLLVRRVLPRWAILPVQVGLFASAVVVLYAYPLLGGWGHTARAGPSRLPHDYAESLIWVLGAICLVCALGAIAARQWRRRPDVPGLCRSVNAPTWLGFSVLRRPTLRRRDTSGCEHDERHPRRLRLTGDSGGTTQRCGAREPRRRHVTGRDLNRLALQHGRFRSLHRRAGAGREALCRCMAVEPSRFESEMNEERASPIPSLLIKDNSVAWPSVHDSRGAADVEQFLGLRALERVNGTGQLSSFRRGILSAVAPPVPEQFGVLPAGIWRQVVHVQSTRGPDRRPHLLQVIGAVRACAKVVLEPAAIRARQCPFQIVGDQLHYLLAYEVGSPS